MCGGENKDYPKYYLHKKRKKWSNGHILNMQPLLMVDEIT
jgi:hypothetical protein